MECAVKSPLRHQVFVLKNSTSKNLRELEVAEIAELNVDMGQST